jgi:UDP-3-O-[3-hydroxymyristoyl] glucosamine N-acyltransferase
VLLSKIALSLKSDFIGDDIELDSMNDVSNASSTQLTFAISKKYSLNISNSSSRAFLINKLLIQYLPKNSSYILCDNVSLSMAYATKLFYKKPIEKNLKKAIIDAITHFNP